MDKRNGDRVRRAGSEMQLQIGNPDFALKVVRRPRVETVVPVGRVIETVSNRPGERDAPSFDSGMARIVFNDAIRGLDLVAGLEIETRASRSHRVLLTG